MRMFVVAVIALSGSQVLAADGFFKGVYLQSEELCAKAKKDGLQTVIEEGNIILTERGLESIEYNCEFVQVTKATRAPTIFVNAICQEPGYVFPDVLSITELSPSQTDVVSVKGPGEDGDGGNSASYYFCDGVPLP